MQSFEKENLIYKLKLSNLAAAKNKENKKFNSI